MVPFAWGMESKSVLLTVKHDGLFLVTLKDFFSRD